MRTLWNDGWRFALLEPDSTWAQFSRAETAPVTLPHDWLIADTDHLYQSGDGWYVKELIWDGARADRSLWLEFDGVYFDAEVLLNGRVLTVHRYGYTAFRTALAPGLRPGSNQIAVHVRYRSPSSRWYSGAGIFRDVHLLSLPAHHLVPDGIRVRTEPEGDAWRLCVRAETEGEGPEPVLRLLDPAGAALAQSQLSGGCCSLALRHIRPWSPEEPVLYTLQLTLGEETEQLSVGFRTIRFDPARGFFLNGQHRKLKGVNLHHDLGCLGSAFHAPAAERQLRLMKAMGANAVRCAHNPPARQLLDLCDRLGLLVMDELYDMWELPKNAFDHARFFAETWREDTAAWVRRDRCHPCVILWSIGNEIQDMHVSGQGPVWTRRLMEEVRRHDDGHAAVTFGSNYMPWAGAQACADIVKLPGYNYAEKYYPAHRQAHPDWCIYGSETGSHVQSRGVYHFPMRENILADEDWQCSSLLNSRTSWGTQNICAMLVHDREDPRSPGQFIWCGIDYLGEPTPYHTRCCYFGQADTAGFPKDTYYLYQAMWQNEPMVHIGVSWDWNPGQMIDVPVMTNGASAELFLNGMPLGRKEVDLADAARCLPCWQVPFAPGELLARAYGADGRVLCEDRRFTPGEPAALCLTAEPGPLRAGCGDIAFLVIIALDAEGHPVENAANRVHVRVEGAGVLLGMDNGDSTDTDPMQTDSRRLFSGRLLAMAGAQEAGALHVRAESPGLAPASLTLDVQPCTPPQPRLFRPLCRASAADDALLPRRIDLAPLAPPRLSPASPSVLFRVRAVPPMLSPDDLRFRLTNDAGVTLPCGTVSLQPDGLLKVTALADGQFWLRASDPPQGGHCRLISQYPLQAEGFGPLGLDPYTFLPAALTDIRIGEITPGNEQGVAFARDGFSAAGYSGIDFGPVGSDELTLPVFALDSSPCEITLWDGIPGEGGKRLAVLPYQKPSCWNVYQPETYRLGAPLTGVHTLCFSMEKKIHLQGMIFTRQSRALRRLNAAEADEIYGDSFRMDGNAVREIGNNVTLRFDHMDFGSAARMRLTLTGGTPLDENAVNLRVLGAGGESVSAMCGFRGPAASAVQSFVVPVLPGECQVMLVFLPGCRFDLESLQFSEVDDHGV